MFDNTLDGILILDECRVYLEANQAALRLPGTVHHELVGQAVDKFFASHGDFRVTWKQFLDRRLLRPSEFLGFLSLGDTRSHTLTHEHLRLARSFAIPAAVAIQNARLYEQAEIFRGDLEQRLAELRQADEVLGKIRQSRQLS